MKGIEMMLANLLGMKPDEMRAQIESALNLMKTGASAAERMQRDIDAIKNHLGITEEVIDNGGRAIANRGNSANGNRIEL
jgi:hypothetical protein